MSESKTTEQRLQRQSDAALDFLLQLKTSPHQFGLFATLRRIECASAPLPRLGQTVRPSEDSVRLGQEPTLAFAPSQIASYDAIPGGKAPRLLVYGPGMFGPNGPLPVHLTEYVRERWRNHDDPTMWRFVDMFHHRLLSLLYRAWANTQPVVSVDRSDDDRFTNYTASLMGMGMDTLRDRDAFPDHGRFSYVGHFARQVRSPQGLASAIESFFEVPVSLKQFVGEWLTIPADSWWRLGSPLSTGGLGLDSTLGASVWGCQHKFRLVLGPVDYETFQSFMPGRETLNRLVALVRSFCGDEFDWDLQMILDKRQIPVLELGKMGQLGRTTWLHDEQRCEDASDTLVHPLANLWTKNRAA